MSDRGVIIQGLDIMDVIRLTTQKTKRYQAVFLQDLEDILDPRSKEFKQIRKLFLDTTNQNMRSVFITIFGDIEHLLIRHE